MQEGDCHCPRVLSLSTRGLRSEPPCVVGREVVVEEDRELELRMSLSVLDHLGLHLYSNVPAVLSEAVANAWDADAESVHVRIDTDSMVLEIQDDGHGMSRDDVNDRFLLVGFRRREVGGAVSPGGRRVMGRKGIGKLSLFSIADRIEVHTVKSGHDPVAFELDAREIRRHYEGVEGEEPFRPPPLEPDLGGIEHGTRILLTDVRRRRLGQASAHLRRRLARRFSVIGAEHGFEVEVDGEPVTIADRGYLEKLQYLWWFGDDPMAAGESDCEASEERPNLVQVVAGGTELEVPVSGWLGTVRRPRELKEEGESLNRVTVLVRGRTAQEDVLDQVDDAGIYTKYLVGEIEADFLDDDDQPDIATSSRQALVEDDPRYQALLSFLRTELSHIESEWARLRAGAGRDRALESPAIREWFEELNDDQRAVAEQLFGKINQLPIEDEADRRRLFTSAVLAFENLEHRHLLDRLATAPHELPATLEAMASLDELEASLYYQIVNHRLETISRLELLIDENALESDIQDLLFEHLWLLDPAWERATDASMHFAERTVTSVFDGLDADLTDEERSGRLDIAWKTAALGHIIVELKRPDRVVTTEEISAQVRKYRSAFRKALRDCEGQENPDVQVVVIVGRDLGDWRYDEGREDSERILAESRTRVMKYDELLSRAQASYTEFIERREEFGRIVRLIERIEAEDLPDQ